MKGLAYYLPFVLLVVFGAVLGFLMGEYQFDLGWAQLLVIVIVVVSLLWGRNAYIMLLTKNMRNVEKLLYKYRKRPYFAFLIACINGNYEEAEKQLENVKNDQQKASGQAVLYIQRKQLEQAKAENQKIKNDEIRLYNSALIFLQEGDQEGFQTAKNKVKSEATKYILRAEEAYMKGEINEAERLGNLAVSTARGFKRYALLKSLEREQNNPNRETYF